MNMKAFALIAALLTLTVVVGMMPYSTVLIVPVVLLAVGVLSLWAIGVGLGRTLCAAGQGTVAMRRRLGGVAMRGRLVWFWLALGAVAAALAGVGVATMFGEIGLWTAVVSLGYVLALGAAYTVYRLSKVDGELADDAVEDFEEEEEEGMEAAWEGLQAARNADLLRGLSEEQVSRVLDIAQLETISAGAPLAQAGALGEWLYIILDGSVELTGSSNVGEVTVRIARGGEAFPLAALLGDGELVTSASAMTDVTTLAIPRQKLLALCDRRPDIGATLFRTTAELLAERYRVTLSRHLDGISDAVRQPERWANV